MAKATMARAASSRLVPATAGLVEMSTRGGDVGGQFGLQHPRRAEAPDRQAEGFGEAAVEQPGQAQGIGERVSFPVVGHRHHQQVGAAPGEGHLEAGGGAGGLGGRRRAFASLGGGDPAGEGGIAEAGGVQHPRGA